MAKERKSLTAAELSVIEDHCKRLLDGAEMIIPRFQRIVERTGDGTAKRSLSYWKNYRSALRQVITTARQRAGVPVNG